MGCEVLSTPEALLTGPTRERAGQRCPLWRKQSCHSRRSCLRDPREPVTPSHLIAGKCLCDVTH